MTNLFALGNLGRQGITENFCIFAKVSNEKNKMYLRSLKMPKFYFQWSFSMSKINGFLFIKNIPFMYVCFFKF